MTGPRVHAGCGVALTLLACCASPSPSPDLLRLRATPDGRDTRVTVVAAPGLEINARLAPALELPNGTVVRFVTGRRSADSAYFAEPPSARLPGRHERVHGTLRASVCRDDERVCHTLSLQL
jgi:hypothetical protein